MGYGSGIGTAVAQVAAVARVRSLAWELLHTVGAAKKKKKKKKKSLIEEKNEVYNTHKIILTEF